MTSIKFLVKSFLVVCLFFIAAAFFAAKAFASSRLYFDPSSLTVGKNTDFQVKIQIDVESQNAFGAETIINYPSSDLSVKSVTNGGFFSDFESPQETGKIILRGYFSANWEYKNGNGTFAVITFSSNKDSGTGTAGFSCADSMILDSNGQNILSCGNLNQFSLTYGTPPSSPTPTSAPTNGCGGTCGSNSNCNSNLSCYQGYCKNPSCVSETDCDCSTPTPKPKAKANPTPEIVTLTAVTPYPSLSPESTPAEEQQAQKKFNIKSLAIWLGVGILAIIAIWLIIKFIKKNRFPKINPPQSDGGVTTTPVTPPLGQTPKPPLGI